MQLKKKLLIEKQNYDSLQQVQQISVDTKGNTLSLEMTSANTTYRLHTYVKEKSTKWCIVHLLQISANSNQIKREKRKSKSGQ